MEKKNEKGKVQLKGQLKLYIQWPAIMSLLLIAMDLWVYKLDHRAGILMAVFVVVYIIMVGGLYFYSKNIIMKDLVEFAAQYGIVQNTLLRELRRESWKRRMKKEKCSSKDNSNFTSSGRLLCPCFS